MAHTRQAASGTHPALAPANYPNADASHRFAAAMRGVAHRRHQSSGFAAYLHIDGTVVQAWQPARLAVSAGVAEGVSGRAA